MRPFTTMEGKRLRGLSKQMTQPNFLHELLDIRVMQDHAKHNQAFDAPVRKSLLVDARQDCKYQMSSGSVSMLTGSRIFWFHRDRCLCPVEHMMQLGWSPLDVEPACCVANTMAELEAEACGKAAKRRRGKMPLVATTIVDLAGNAQALPDLAFFAIPLLYAINRPDLFAHIVEANDLESFGVHSASDLVVGLDPDMAQAALKDFFKSALPPLEVGEDLDSGGDSG